MNKAMPWTTKRYPSSMKNLRGVVRNKAIEIANAILNDSDMDEGLVIATAISRAKDWAENHHKKQDDPALSKTTDEKMHGKDRYMVPYVNTGWAVKEEGEREVEKIFNKKKDAKEKATKEAKKINGAVTIQTKTERIEKKVSFNPANTGKKQQ
jgi:uncharacterized protein YdaT